MAKKQAFIDYISTIINEDEMSEEAKQYWQALKISDAKDGEKTKLTDNGRLILDFMKNNLDTVNWTAKVIAENLNISSRIVSGSMRKLVSDGFVEKLGESPVIYTLTENGKNFNE